MDYLRRHILTYMRAQAKHIAPIMLHKFEQLKDVSEPFQTVKRASGKVHYVTGKDGKRIRKTVPDKILKLNYDNPRLTMSTDLLEKVIIKVATNGRFITNNAGPKMRVTLTVRDMMLAHALDKKLTQSLYDGLAKDAPRSWTKFREKMVKDALAKYKEETNGGTTKKSQAGYLVFNTKKSKKDDDSDEDEDSDDEDIDDEGGDEDIDQED